MLRTNSGACDVNIILSFSVRLSYVFETKNYANGSLSSRHITDSTVVQSLLTQLACLGYISFRHR